MKENEAVPVPEPQNVTRFTNEHAAVVQFYGERFTKTAAIWAFRTDRPCSVVTREGESEELPAGYWVATDGKTVWPIADDFMQQNYAPHSEGVQREPDAWRVEYMDGARQKHMDFATTDDMLCVWWDAFMARGSNPTYFDATRVRAVYFDTPPEARPRPAEATPLNAELLSALADWTKPPGPPSFLRSETCRNGHPQRWLTESVASCGEGSARTGCGITQFIYLASDGPSHRPFSIKPLVDPIALGLAWKLARAMRLSREASAEGPEVEAFKERLRRKGAAIEAARLSLIQRFREFVNEHARNGSKSGRPDYTRIISLDKLEPLRIALDEYDRVSISKAADVVTAGSRSTETHRSSASDDTRRLDWLDEASGRYSGVGIIGFGQTELDLTVGSDEYTGRTLREAIDAAMRAQKVQP